jgi:t-SNARE complex subunit (syntaxin)
MSVRTLDFLFRSARRKKIFCAVLLSIVLLIVVLVVLIEFGVFSGGGG